MAVFGANEPSRRDRLSACCCPLTVNDGCTLKQPGGWKAAIQRAAPTQREQSDPCAKPPDGYIRGRMNKIHFPFLRGEKHTFSELRAFEAALLKIRQEDPVFSGDLRSNKLPWAKARNEELLPIVLLADHKGFADSEEFELMPEGHPTDVTVYAARNTRAYQITVADPAWDVSGPGSSGGYLHHLRMEQLRLGEPAFGGANTRKEYGVIVSEPHARNVQDDIDACRRRLVEAIKRKRTHDGTGCTLLIFARGYRFLLIDVDVAELVADVVYQAAASKFERFCVLDEKFLWESQ
jgi:hypothetical protein